MEDLKYHQVEMTLVRHRIQINPAHPERTIRLLLRHAGGALRQPNLLLLQVFLLGFVRFVFILFPDLHPAPRLDLPYPARIYSVG
jgi:hypothetical protein